ncbi:hypothetical protein ACF0H5_008918 [Mactra antiquata]
MTRYIYLGILERTQLFFNFIYCDINVADKAFVSTVSVSTTMMFLWTFALMVISVAKGMDETKLWRIPPPIKGFLWEPSSGRWYYQFRKSPCSWSGSNEFTDYEMLLRTEGKNSMLMTLTMRNGVCNSANHRMIFMSPGVYTTKDLLGGSFSGTYIYVAGYYKTFFIVYGCTKMSVLGDKCEDASIDVRTRIRYPDKAVIAMINDALLQLWGITVDELQRVKHIESCFQKKPFIQ